MMSMPHPRTKNNAGYPDGYKDKAVLQGHALRGVGYRWGMGIDRSERRLCEIRCLPLLDETSNWFANDPMDSVRSPRIEPTHMEGPGRPLIEPALYRKRALVFALIYSSSRTPDAGSGRVRGLRISKSSTTKGRPFNCTPASSTTSMNPAAEKRGGFRPGDP